MNKLLFLAPFPTPENIKDGMINRVDAIDSTVKDIDRAYLHVSLFKYWKKVTYRSGKSAVYNLNIFRHFFLINKIMKNAGTIYTHSIHGFTYLWHLLPFLKARIILDAHGVVPEELKYFSRYKFRYFYYEFLEKKVIRKTADIICVTNNMRHHFESKYPHFKGRFYIYNIFPRHIRKTNPFRKTSDKVNILYSGGISPWQNIDLMLKIIAGNSSPRIKYTILAGNMEYVRKRMQHYGIAPDDIELNSVMPDELAHYYEQTDYAFILRDDNIVNRVACPTKLVEYLNYGIIPIVLSPYIGDFYEYGYEYVSCSNFDINIKKPTNCSVVNTNIVQKMENNNNRLNIKELILVPAE